MNPEGEAGKRIQPVRPLVVVQEAAAVPPSSTFILRRLRRLPFPRPIELDGGAAVGREVAHMLHVGVVLEVRICVELSRYQIIQLFCIRSMGKCEACKAGIKHFRAGSSDTVYSRAGSLTGLGLSDDKGKAEVQLLLIS